MALVKGPNGLVLEMADGIAKDLVDSPSGDYEYAAEPRSEKLPASKAPSSKSKK